MMAEAYGWTLDYIDTLPVFWVQRLAAASRRVSESISERIGGEHA